MNTAQSRLSPIDPSHISTVAAFGGTLTPLEPVGAQVSGIDLSSEAQPPRDVLDALEQVMAKRGFLVFKNDTEIDHEAFLRASCWWGGRDLHSTHGVHPATPDGNPHIFPSVQRPPPRHPRCGAAMAQ